MLRYGRLKVADLRKLCDERALQHAVINQVRLIKALQYNDGDKGNGLESVTVSDAVGSDVEVEVGGDAYSM